MAKSSRTLFKNPGRTMQRIESVLHAWELIAPRERFSGMTLEEFKQAVGPSIVARKKLADLELAMSAAIQARTLADMQSHRLASMVIYAVLSTPDTRISDGMYRAMGFVPGNERASGLTRKSPTRKKEK